MYLALDLGSKNMKISGLIDETIQHKLIKSMATPNSIGENRVVEVNGRKIYFGAGSPLVKRDKTEREYILESIMLAAYEIYGHLAKEFEIGLGIGLPLNQFRSSAKDEYKQKLKELYLSQKITGKVNGYDISVKIKFIEIYAEGYSSFASLYNFFDKDIQFLIVDIGYKTTEVIGVSIEDELIIDGHESINKGMLEIMNSIKDGFYNDNKIEYPVETIDNALINNLPLKVGFKKIKPKLEYGTGVVTEIFNKIETDFFPDMRARNIYLIGGGANLVYDIIKDKLDVNILEDKEQSMFANADGYLYQLIRDTL